MAGLTKCGGKYISLSKSEIQPRRQIVYVWNVKKCGFFHSSDAENGPVRKKNASCHINSVPIWVSNFN